MHAAVFASTARPLQVSRAILGDKKPLTTRPSATLPPANFAAVKSQLQEQVGEVLGEITDELTVSSLLYPKVCGVTRLPSLMHFRGDRDDQGTGAVSSNSFSYLSFRTFCD